MTSKEFCPSSTALYHAFNDTVIRELADNYAGRFKNAVDLVPEVFDLYVRLLEETSFPADGRLILNSAIAYFISPFVGPDCDEHLSTGLLDDLYLCAWVLKRLEREYGFTFIEDHWNGYVTLPQALDTLEKTTNEFIGDLEGEVVSYFEEWLGHCASESISGDGRDIVERLLYLV